MGRQGLGAVCDRALGLRFEAGSGFAPSHVFGGNGVRRMRSAHQFLLLVPRTFCEVTSVTETEMTSESPVVHNNCFEGVFVVFFCLIPLHWPSKEASVYWKHPFPAPFIFALQIYRFCHSQVVFITVLNLLLSPCDCLALIDAETLKKCVCKLIH